MTISPKLNPKQDCPIFKYPIPSSRPNSNKQFFFHFNPVISIIILTIIRVTTYERKYGSLFNFIDTITAETRRWFLFFLFLSVVTHLIQNANDEVHVFVSIITILENVSQKSAKRFRTVCRTYYISVIERG